MKLVWCHMVCHVIHGALIYSLSLYDHILSHPLQLNVKDLYPATAGSCWCWKAFSISYPCGTQTRHVPAVRDRQTVKCVKCVRVLLSQVLRGETGHRQTDRQTVVVSCFLKYKIHLFSDNIWINQLQRTI